MAISLPEEIEAQVADLFQDGESLLDAGEDEQALVRFRTAWDLIPEPKGQWLQTLQVLSSLADCLFFLDDFESCSRTLQFALCNDISDSDNPWICLRLGQCYLRLGQEPEAGNWLVSALVTGGTEMFDDEDEGYRQFLVQRLSPPPGGWPDGW